MSARESNETKILADDRRAAATATLYGRFLEGSARQPELAPMLRTRLFLVIGFLDVIAMIGVGIGLFFAFANPYIAPP